MISQKFNRLIIVEKWSIKGRTYYKCVCDCGNKIIVRSDSLKSGNTKSCGCLKEEKDFINKIIHGQAISNNHTKEYKAWEKMKVRCYNPNYHAYHRYGGRGIKVCDKWLNSFEAFFTDVGKAPSLDHSIDRIDNDGNYEPGNVKWSTQYEQVNNRG